MAEHKSDPITVRFPAKLLAKIESVAKQEGRTRSNAVVVLVARALGVKL